MSIPVQVTPRALDLKQSLPQKTPIDAAADHLGGMVVSELFGKYYNLCRAGVVYAGLPSAAAIPAAGTIFNACWWNPSSSGVLMVPIRLTMSYPGTAQAAGVNDAFLFRGLFAGDTIGVTNAPLSGFTAGIAPVNQFISMANTGGNVPNTGASGRPSRVRSGNSATATGAGTIDTLRYISISQQAVATTGTNVLVLSEDFDGSMIISPGHLFGPQAESAASGDKWLIQLIWAEVPL